ncbi:hypothetical protein J3Q64DRAFT_1693472 [Phycomyces blakesleeanus]|uniref:Uncharacterized protein n=1 Tax=Phycomyces blakesleeanus TaxID=4837 RepID=A0ABR3BFY8_PHYBL
MFTRVPIMDNDGEAYTIRMFDKLCELVKCLQRQLTKVQILLIGFRPFIPFKKASFEDNIAKEITFHFKHQEAYSLVKITSPRKNTVLNKGKVDSTNNSMTETTGTCKTNRSDGVTLLNLIITQPASILNPVISSVIGVFIFQLQYSLIAISPNDYGFGVKVMSTSKLAVMFLSTNNGCLNINNSLTQTTGSYVIRIEPENWKAIGLIGYSYDNHINKSLDQKAW